MTHPRGLRSLHRSHGALPRHDSRDAEVRLAVRWRARDACEYCLMPTLGRFEVDHIIPPTHWEAYVARRLPVPPVPSDRHGPDHVDNFAWTCPFCNRAKLQQTTFVAGGRPVRLFDPRRDRWPEHFVLARLHLFIMGTTRIGRATELALRLNDTRLDGPIGTRHALILAGLYPPPWARPWAITPDAVGL